MKKLSNDESYCAIMINNQDLSDFMTSAFVIQLGYSLENAENLWHVAWRDFNWANMNSDLINHHINLEEVKKKKFKWWFVDGPFVWILCR